jgi:hypothetical protein
LHTEGDLNTFHLNPAVGPTHPLIQWVPGLFPGGKGGGKRDVCQSPPAVSEVKNEWMCTSAPRVCLHGVDRANFTFAFFVSFSADEKENLYFGKQVLAVSIHWFIECI